MIPAVTADTLPSIRPPTGPSRPNLAGRAEPTVVRSGLRQRMKPLDLSIAPPRSAKATTAGVVFLPRTIDKLRAMLPGGTVGEYRMEGFSDMMLERFGIMAEALVTAVAKAATDDEIGAIVRRDAAPGSIDAWNEFATNRKIYNGNRDEAVADHPWLAAHPEIVLTLDFVDADDRRGFPST
jgi:hypothetical protein